MSGSSLTVHQPPLAWVPIGERGLGAGERQAPSFACRRKLALSSLAVLPEAPSWPRASPVRSVSGSCFCRRKFVVTKGNIAQLYHAPGRKREFNAFVLDKTYFGPYDETTCIDWTEDSR